MFDVLYELRLRELFESKDSVSVVRPGEMLPVAARNDGGQEAEQAMAGRPKAEAA